IKGVYKDFVQFIQNDNLLELHHLMTKLCSKYGIMYIDLHSLFGGGLVHLKAVDGINWNAIGHRIMTEIIINYCKAFWNGADLLKNTDLRNYSHYIKTHWTVVSFQYVT
ncbi:unnamed protein product, partial [Didymodactylos carnosus]